MIAGHFLLQLFVYLMCMGALFATMSVYYMFLLPLETPETEVTVLSHCLILGMDPLEEQPLLFVLFLCSLFWAVLRFESLRSHTC